MQILKASSLKLSFIDTKCGHYNGSVTFRLNILKGVRRRFPESSLHEKFIASVSCQHMVCKLISWWSKVTEAYLKKSSHFPVHVLIESAIIMDILAIFTNNNVI